MAYASAPVYIWKDMCALNRILLYPRVRGVKIRNRAWDCILAALVAICRSVSTAIAGLSYALAMGVQGMCVSSVDQSTTCQDLWNDRTFFSAILVHIETDF